MRAAIGGRRRTFRAIAASAALVAVGLAATVAGPASPAGAATGPVLHVTKTAVPATLPPGSTTTSTFTVTNTGDAASTATTTVTSYSRSTSGGLSVTFTAASGVACSLFTPRYGNKRSTCQIPALDPGASFTIGTAKVVAPATVGYAGLTASATTTGPSDSATASFKVRGSGPANLTAAVYVQPATQLVGRTATATVTISDQGYSPAEGATTTVALPAGSTDIVPTAPAGTSCTTSGVAVACTTATIQNGGALSLTIAFSAPSTAAVATIGVTADSGGVVVETDEGDNAAATSLDVRAAAAALQVAIANPTTVDQGTAFTKTVTVTNVGGATAPAVTVADRFTGITFYAATGPAGTSCKRATSYSGKPPKLHVIGATCSFGDLAPGESRTLTLTLTVPGTQAQGSVAESATASTTAYVDPLVNPSATSTMQVVAPSTVSKPFATAKPTITGNANTGQSLTTTNGTWVSYGTPTFQYLWFRCFPGGACEVVGSASSATYDLTAADVGASITVWVWATNAGGTTAMAASNSIGPILGATPPVSTVAPTLVAGLEKQPGFNWAVTTGTWSGSPTITYAYQWLRCAVGGGTCVEIPGATTSSYWLTTADVFHSVQVRVTATNSAGSATVLSDVSPEIDPADGP